jgi:hypothetical protein
MNFAPSLPDAVDVGRLTDHQPLVVDARLHPANVVTHDEKDVGPLGGRLSERSPRRHHHRRKRQAQRSQNTSCIFHVDIPCG